MPFSAGMTSRSRREGEKRQQEPPPRRGMPATVWRPRCQGGRRSAQGRKRGRREIKSAAHAKQRCRDHRGLAPKARGKETEESLRAPCRQKGAERIGAEAPAGDRKAENFLRGIAHHDHGQKPERMILKPDKKLEKLFIAQGASGFYETA